MREVRERVSFINRKARFTRRSFSAGRQSQR
jgi:hypothetical protein